MRFGPVPLDQARGAILAHSANLPGGRLRKGCVLGDADIARMAAAGWHEVIVARLDRGDLHEDAAAARLGAALVPDEGQGQGQGLRLSVPATGRVNLLATGPGVLRLDAGAVTEINAINPMLTLATLPPHARVAAGTMAATVKIIAYGIPERDVARAEALCGGAIAVLAPRHSRAHLIETVIAGRATGDKGRVALAARLDRLGLVLASHGTVPHEVAALTAAIAAAPAGDPVFVLTASATSDPADVGPAALRRAGGAVTQVGMPVDPGNLLFLGHQAGRPVIGLPGCARSPALNGADWVLERVLCGVTLGPADFAAMGVGGLLTEIASRPRPRAG